MKNFLAIISLLFITVFLGELFAYAWTYPPPVKNSQTISIELPEEWPEATKGDLMQVISRDTANGKIIITLGFYKTK